MAILVTIFLLVFAVQLVTWIGQSLLLGATYSLYLRLFYSASAKRQRALKSEILSNKSELQRTSAQDQFAKWAKLRRSVDKGLQDLEKLNKELASTKQSFSFVFNGFMFVFTNCSSFMIGFWYKNAPVFWLPPGWFGPLTWWMSFPFAPKGSVSVGLWQMACKRILLIGERVVKAQFSKSSEENPVPVDVPEKEVTEEKKTS